MNVWKKIYQQARGITVMGDGFMEPREYEYAEQVVQEVYSSIVRKCSGNPI